MARGASRANASGAVEASGTDTTVLKVEGNFNVTGPLETFANAGGVHVARAILAEFAENAPKVRFAQDSPLEGRRFEPSVPGEEEPTRRDGLFDLSSISVPRRTEEGV